MLRYQDMPNIVVPKSDAVLCWYPLNDYLVSVPILVQYLEI